MKPLCLVPWTSIDISPRGAIAPCCKFAPGTDELMNITSNTIDEYTNSELLNKVKQQMLDQEWPAGCIRCKTEEESDIQSKRQLDYERWQNDFDNYKEEQGFIIASIAFGNTCNLKCITCGPSSSSRWRKEYQDLYSIDRPPIEIIDNLTSDEIYRALPNAIHFDIPGGEPFLSEIQKQLDLLQRYVDNGQSKNITLHYTTNAQVWPNDTWWDLWANFKEIDMQLSIDGVGPRYEYIRYPAKQHTLEHNLYQYLEKENSLQNFRLSVSHTVSAYNIYYLDEFFTWCKSVSLPRPWCGRVHTPLHMRPCVFPTDIKNKIINHMKTSSHPDVHTWSNYLENNDSSEHWDRFMNMRDKHDVYRNTNFAQTFPEVEDLINGI